jgi:hypothetical protein
LSESAELEADDLNVYFVLANCADGPMLELARPGAPDALPYVSRQCRALALGRLRSDPWKLYELRWIESKQMWGLVVLDEAGQREARIETLIPVHSEEVTESIQSQDRWSGPKRPNELLPQSWEGKLRIRHGKPVFVKEPVARETSKA